MDTYRDRANRLMESGDDFVSKLDLLLADRFGAPHILDGGSTGDNSVFVTCENANQLQSAWAAGAGLPAKTDFQAILLAQIEHHRSEVFYNTGTVSLGASFVNRLPGCVKKKIAWRAAPGGDFAAYDLVVNNFPSIRRDYEMKGWRTAEFFPSHDPVLDFYAEIDHRDIDILFIGGYTRHHTRRNAILTAVAELASKYSVVFNLDGSRYTWLAQTPIGFFGPLASMRRPRAIRSVSAPPVYGLDFYRQLSRAKIIVNAAIDMSGSDRGNMRCFEALGAGCLMLTDDGNYPPGMEDGSTMVVYRSAEELRDLIDRHLDQDSGLRIAKAGHAMVRERYSKSRQMADFLSLAENIA